MTQLGWEIERSLPAPTHLAALPTRLYDRNEGNSATKLHIVLAVAVAVAVAIAVAIAAAVAVAVESGSSDIVTTAGAPKSQGGGRSAGRRASRHRCASSPAATRGTSRASDGDTATITATTTATVLHFVPGATSRSPSAACGNSTVRSTRAVAAWLNCARPRSGHPAVVAATAAVLTVVMTVAHLHRHARDVADTDTARGIAGGPL